MDTIEQGQFLNEFKHYLRACITQLDARGVEQFENTSREAHEIRHEIGVLIDKLRIHGITLEETPIVEVTDEEIQQAIEAVRRTLREKITGYKGEDVHPVNASYLLDQLSDFPCRHWTQEDGQRFNNAWDAAGRK
jgi:hypothetical protein